jgi:hypothetical protein
MPRRLPDFSFVREGRPLGAWLRGLVAEDAPTRLAAGEALQAMMYGVPSVHTDLAEIEWGSSGAISGHMERFKDAVRCALKSPDFDARDFFRKLILYRMALKDNWRRRVAEDFARHDTRDVYEERLLRRLQAADDDVDRTEAARRYMRWLCASLRRDLERGRDAYDGAESLAAPGIASGIIFDALDVALLADRPGLRAMLADKDLRGDAARALERIGPPAVDFAAGLLEDLDAATDARRFFGARALGSIGRDDPVVIDGLLRRVRFGPVAVRSGAAEALGHAGPPLAGRLDVAIDLLLGASYTPELMYAAISALSSVGRNSESALSRVLELAGPRPQRRRTSEDFPDHEYDEVMMERGVAIDALRHFIRFADRVVPVLVDSLDSFEEYDPDWGYDGEHGRVCAALASFGPRAVPAVPRLVRYLEEWAARPIDEREWPKDVFGLLAAIGPPAAAALPVLEMLRADGPTSSEELDPDDPFDRAILHVRES